MESAFVPTCPRRWRLRDVKGRAAEKALTVHIGSPGAMRLYVPDPPGLAERFAQGLAWTRHFDSRRSIVGDAAGAGGEEPGNGRCDLL